MVNLKKLEQTLLDTIVDNFSHFRQHPDHLAWVVMNYGLIEDVGGREPFVVIDTSEVSPQQRTYERLGSRQDGNILSAAFDLIDTGFDRFPDSNPNIPLQLKPNKTFDDWVELITGSGDFDYFTHPRDQVLSDLLGVNHSTHYRWNDEGYLMRVGRSGVEYRIFLGYTRVENEVPEQIRERVLKVRDHPEIKASTLPLQRRYERQRQQIYSGETWTEVFVPDWVEHNTLLREAQALLAKHGATWPRGGPRKENKIIFTLHSDSNLVIAPINAHPSYLGAGREISDRILSDGSSTPDSLRLSRQFLVKLDSGYFQRSQ